MSHTNECCIFAIARHRLFELTSDSLQSREKVTGAPYAVRPLLVVESIDRFLPVRMCGFTAVTGTSITKLTLIQQANLTSLTHLIFNLRKPFYARRLRGTELSESQRCPIPGFITVSNHRTSIE